MLSKDTTPTIGGRSCGRLDDPRSLYRTRICLEPLSKNGEGRLRLLHRDEQRCDDGPSCTTLKTDHALELEVQGHDPCDSDLGRRLDGVIMARIVHAFTRGSGESRGAHTGVFSWVGDGLEVEGELAGMTNVGTHREPVFDPCQECHQPGDLEGRLCGRVVQAKDERLIGCRVTAVYRMRFDPSKGFQTTGVRATIEGVVVCPCERGRCLDLTTFPEATHANPWAIGGITFQVFDHLAAPTPTTRVVTWGGLTGLDAGYTTRVEFPSPINSVTITLAHFSTPPTVVAVDGSGVAVDSATMTVAGAAETLHLTGAGIVALKISAPQDETLILEVCNG